MRFRETAVPVIGALIIPLIPIITALDIDPVKSFCKKFYHQTAVIGNRLYIDGGLVTYADSPSVNKTNPTLMFEDLDDDTYRIPQLVNNLTKPAEVPSVAGGALWADETNEMLYLFGGEFPDGDPTDTSSALWSYDPWVDKWAKVATDGTIQRPSFGSHVAINNQGMGYYLGGWLGPNNVKGWKGPRLALSSMMVYDMVGNTFRNETGPQGDPRVEGNMLFVPVGDAGVLISFGGWYAKSGREDQLVPAPMNDVDVYDVNQRSWYRVNATGEIPNPRRRFCSGVASAEDASSHNAYIYGGASVDAKSPGLDDIYILSMPTFEWIKLWDHNLTGPAELQGIHNGFTCNVVKDSQMIVMGGTFPFSDSTCDVPTAFGTHVMDMGLQNPDTTEWYGYRKNLTTYSLPAPITDVIGGKPDGEATKTTPAGGFESWELGILFSRKLVTDPRKPTRTPDAVSSPNPTESKAAAKKSIALVVGPSVGVGIPAVAVGLGVFLLLRRRSQQQKSRYNQQRNLQLDLADPRGYDDDNGLQPPPAVYQLPTTQSPMHSPNSASPTSSNGKAGLYNYPVQPIYPDQSGLYKPNGAFYGYGDSKSKELGLGLGIGNPHIEPQELPAARVSIAPGRTETGHGLGGPPVFPGQRRNSSVYGDEDDGDAYTDVDLSSRRGSRRDSDAERLMEKALEAWSGGKGNMI